jgi:hypothetical protein
MSYIWNCISLIVFLACVGGGLLMFASSAPTPMPTPTPASAPTHVPAPAKVDAEAEEQARALGKAMKWGVRVIPI